MKKVKILLTVITVLTITGGTLAFKAYKPFDGSYICRAAGAGMGICPNSNDPANHYRIHPTGQFRYCNNGANSTTCNNLIKVVQDPR